MSNFSVVTKISTNGYTLKLSDCTFLSRFYYACYHNDYDYITQIALADDNKGVSVKFRKKMSKKWKFFAEKNSYKIAPPFKNKYFSLERDTESFLA